MQGNCPAAPSIATTFEIFAAPVKLNALNGILFYFFASFELLHSRAAVAHFLAAKEQRNWEPDFDIYGKRRFVKGFFSKGGNFFYYKPAVNVFRIAVYINMSRLLLTVDSAITLSVLFLKYPASGISFKMPCKAINRRETRAV